MARNAIIQYLELLDAGDLTGASEMFTEDAQYIRPSREPGHVGSLTTLLGRAAITEHFRQRGAGDFAHEIRRSAVTGETAFVEGFIAGSATRQPVVFVSSADVDASGLITRYISVIAVTDE